MTNIYDILLKYPEFDYKEVREKYKVWVEDDSETGDGHHEYPPWIFDTKLAYKYLILTYAPESEYAGIKELNERKKIALKDSKVPEDQWNTILSNGNPMVGDMLTRFFREYRDFDYELLVSSAEAIVTLLDVVRKPINSRLLDDKERNAVKAKRECFDDAKYLMQKAKEMLKELSEDNEEVADHARKSVFEGGLAERFAKNTERKD